MLLIIFIFDGWQLRAKPLLVYYGMDSIIQEKPPWKTVEYIQSPVWTFVSFPEITYSENWVSNDNADIIAVKDKIKIALKCFAQEVKDTLEFKVLFL